MKPCPYALATLCAFLACACHHAAAAPSGLVTALQRALDKGDFESARKLADIDQAPADVHYFYMDMVRNCASEDTCTVSEAPATEEVHERMRKQAEALGAQMPQIEGMIIVASTSRDGTGSGTMEMPYGKVGNDYRIVTVRYSDAQLVALRAKTDETLTAELFAKGIYDPASRERRTDWATAATRLPADGGDVGKAFVAGRRAMAAAIDANDPDAAMQAGGQMAKLRYAEEDFSGKPVAMEERKRKLYVQALRELRDVKVNGGFRLGDRAVLLIEARNGIGWIERGPILLSNDDGYWGKAGDNLVSYPASP